MESIFLTLVSEAPTLALLLIVLYMSDKRITQILGDNQSNLSDLKDLLDKSLGTQKSAVESQKILVQNSNLTKKEIEEIKRLVSDLRNRQITIASRIKKNED